MWRETEKRIAILLNLTLHSQRRECTFLKLPAITYVYGTRWYMFDKNDLLCIYAIQNLWFAARYSRIKTRMPEFWYNPDARATPASRYPCGNSNFKQSGEFPLCSQRNVCNCYAWISVTGLLLRCWLDGTLGTWNVLWPILTYLWIISARGRSNFLMICHMQRLSHPKRVYLANVVATNF